MLLPGSEYPLKEICSNPKGVFNEKSCPEDSDLGSNGNRSALSGTKGTLANDVRIVHQYNLWNLQQHPDPCEKLHLFRRLPYVGWKPDDAGYD